MYQNDPMKVLTGEVRLSYVHLSAPYVNPKQPNGEPFVERRAGLVDRSKTIWAMVYPNDYEMVAQ